MGATRPSRIAASRTARAPPPHRLTHPHAAAGATKRRGAAAGRLRGVWHTIGPHITGVVDPLVGAQSDDDDGLGGPSSEAVVQTLWLRHLAEEQRSLLRDRLLPMPEPRAGRDAGAAQAAAQALQRDGVVFLRSVVPRELCDALKADVDARAARARLQLGPGLRRVDALLDWSGAGRAAANAAAGPGGVAAVLSRLPDATADAQLVEFSVLSTEPGAQRQVLHPDARADASHAPLYSLFVALQDVAPEMGPTTFILRTHDAASHAAFPAGPLVASARALLRDAHAVDAPLRKGDAALYDARVFHAGGCNDPHAGARRGLLTLTFVRPPVPPAPERRNSGGAAFSITPEVMALGLTAGEMARQAAAVAAR